MNRCQTRNRNVRLVPVDDQGYTACKRRYAAERRGEERIAKDQCDIVAACMQTSAEETFAQDLTNTEAASAAPDYAPLPIEAYVEGSSGRVFRVTPPYSLAGKPPTNDNTLHVGRSAGPSIGHLVERAARHWLGFQVKLKAGASWPGANSTANSL